MSVGGVSLLMTVRYQY